MADPVVIFPLKVTFHDLELGNLTRNVGVVCDQNVVDHDPVLHGEDFDTESPLSCLVRKNEQQPSR